ncbi:MAG: bifunctional metallophosphatase/5'-nucleotidase [Polyangiaceae bacterium]|nr:bifunctional metallophosphatase/5'-nucleotidase [Polyangiaceae bacterium]
MGTKNVTLLHSNDMHGDFLAEMRGEGGQLIGGLSLLSGYVSHVRRTEKNVLYAIAGDMLRGSILDEEFKGISTIELMNFLAPDVVTLGNHEFDYGLLQLLFLEKVANFPIVNANLYMSKYNKRLMKPFHVVNIDGFDVMFIGIVTDKVIQQLQTIDSELAGFLTLEDATREIGKICNAYKNDDIDLTVLLTHIGFESDKELASMLDPAWGVDIILGGHSHTVLEKPETVNGVLIAQAAVGTDQIGRFDLVVDDVTNSVVDWKWQLVPITDETASPDTELERYIASFQDIVDRKYNTILTKLARPLTHPSRVQETELGNCFADAIAAVTKVDVAFLASGSIRKPVLGPTVTRGDFLAIFPFSDALHRFALRGRDLRRIFEKIMHPKNLRGEGEFYQVSGAVRAVFDRTSETLESLHLRGAPVDDGETYTITLQDFHYKNSASFLGLTHTELMAIDVCHGVATSTQDLLEEYLHAHQHLSATVEGRLRFL